MSDDSKKPYDVFLRKGSVNYWMRFSLPGQGQIRIGLKTPDKSAAEAKAGLEYQKAVWQAEHDMLPGKMSFDKLAKAFLASVEPNERTTTKQRDTYKAHRGVFAYEHDGVQDIIARAAGGEEVASQVFLNHDGEFDLALTVSGYTIENAMEIGGKPMLLISNTQNLALMAYPN